MSNVYGFVKLTTQSITTNILFMKKKIFYDKIFCMKRKFFWLHKSFDVTKIEKIIKFWLKWPRNKTCVTAAYSLYHKPSNIVSNIKMKQIYEKLIL